MQQHLTGKSRVILAGYLSVVGAMAFFVFAPGLVNADTIDMLEQSVSGRFHDWHSPIMSWIWSVTNSVWPGPAIMLLIQLMALLLGLHLVVSRLFSRLSTAFAAATLLLALPPVFSSLGTVNKDSLALALFSSMIGLYLANLFRESTWLLAGWLLVGALVCSVRLDYLPFVFWMCVVRIWNMFNCPITTKTSRLNALTAIGALVISILGGLLATLTVVVVVRTVNYDFLNAESRFPIQATLLHDIAGVSAARNSNYFPQAVKDRGITSEIVKSRYTPNAGDSLFWGGAPSIPFSHNPSEFRELLRTWLLVIVSDPYAYLHHRLAVFYCLITTCTAPVWNYQYETDPRYKKMIDYDFMGLSNPIVGSEFRAAYLKWASGTAFSKGLLYVVTLVAASIVVLMLPRGRVQGLPRDCSRDLFWALCLGAVFHLGLLGFLAPAALFRYLTPTAFISAILLLLTLQIGWGANRATLARTRIG